MLVTVLGRRSHFSLSFSTALQLRYAREISAHAIIPLRARTSSSIPYFNVSFIHFIPLIINKSYLLTVISTGMMSVCYCKIVALRQNDEYIFVSVNLFNDLSIKVLQIFGKSVLEQCCILQIPYFKQLCPKPCAFLLS